MSNSPADLVNIKIGARFLVVTIFPNLAFAALIGALLLAGAPANRPSWNRLETSLIDASFGGAILLGLGVLIVSVVIHPLNYALIQLMEGYWGSLPFGTELQRACAAPFEKYRQHLRDGEFNDLEVGEALYWLPHQSSPTLPTELGNVLLAGEVRAGSRYGYETGVVLPRLLPLLPEAIRAQVADTRNQMDAAARLCGLNVLAVPITVTLLIRHDLWLLVPLMCYMVAWMAYRSSVVAAKRFTVALGVAFDLHHLALWDAASLARPADLEEEFSSKGPLLSTLFDGNRLLSIEERESLAYQEPILPTYLLRPGPLMTPPTSPTASPQQSSSPDLGQS